MFGWRYFSEWDSDCDGVSFAYEDCQYIGYA